MKRNLVATLCATAFLASVASADQLPPRKPGLWELHVSAQGSPEQILKQCADAATDQQLQDMGGKMNSACAKNETTKTATGYKLETDCSMAGSRIQSMGTVTGDFSKGYTIEMTSKYEPPLMGMKEGKTTVSGTWKGECEAGMKPGDVIMPGGQKVSVTDVASMAK